MRSSPAIGVAALFLFSTSAVAQEVQSGQPAARATPMGERTVTIGVLDKVSGRTESYEANPGQIVTFRGLTIAVRACSATPPWANQELTGGFLQIDHRPRPNAEPQRIFSGWLFAETPSLNSVDHPAYDVWVIACKMSFPDTGPDTIIVN